MKKTAFLFLAAVLFFGAFTSCDKQDDEPTLSKAISLNQPTVAIAAEATSVQVIVKTESAWELSALTAASWVIPSATEGEGNTQVTFKIKANKGDNRTAEFSFATDEENEAKIIFNQLGATGTSVTIERASVNETSQKDIDVIVNVSLPEWLASAKLSIDYGRNAELFISNKLEFEGTLTSGQTHTITIPDITLGEVYFVRARLTSEIGDVVSEIYRVVARVPGAPTIENITFATTAHATVATLTVTDNGKGTIEEVGVCFSATNATPTISDNVCKTDDPKYFDNEVRCAYLKASTSYWVCAYVKTELGIVYGDVSTITTREDPFDHWVLGNGGCDAGCFNYLESTSTSSDYVQDLIDGLNPALASWNSSHYDYIRMVFHETSEGVPCLQFRLFYSGSHGAFIYSWERDANDPSLHTFKKIGYDGNKTSVRDFYNSLSGDNLTNTDKYLEFFESDQMYFDYTNTEATEWVYMYPLNNPDRWFELSYNAYWDISTINVVQ